MTRAARLLLMSCLLAVLAACGASSGGGSADADPATLMPPTAALYVEAVVRPEGEQKDGMLAAAGKVLRTPDPEKKIRELLDKAVQDGSDNFDYDRDLKPWLGERAGLYVTNIEAEESEFFGAIAASDTEKAMAAVDAAMKRDKEKTREASYEGVDYKIDDEGVAFGIIDDFLGAGHEKLFKRAVDTSKDGKSLADNKQFKATLDSLDDARIGTAYVDVKTLVDAGLKADPAAREQLEQFKGVFNLEKMKPIGMALLADGERVAIESSVSSEGAGKFFNQLLLLSGDTTPLVAELPGDSWLAYGVPKLGATVESLYDAFAGALGGAALSGQIKQQTGLDLKEDVLSWIGDTAVYARGVDLAAIDGAVVIQATDAAKAKAAVTKIVGVISQQAPQLAPKPTKLDGAETAFSVAVPGTPRPAVIAVGKGRVVIAYGEKAATDGLDAGASKLGDAEGFKRAKDALGGDADPSFYVAMDPVIKILEATPDVTADPDFGKAKPYLATIDSVVSGGEKKGDRLRSRIAVRLK